MRRKRINWGWGGRNEEREEGRGGKEEERLVERGLIRDGEGREEEK